MRWMIIVVVAACAEPPDVVTDPPDEFWADTTPDSAGFDGDLVMHAQRVAIDPGETKTAELVSTLSVGTSESNAERRVVMRLGAGTVPGLVIGDRLITPAEVEVTTRCDVGQTAPGCDYNPSVRAQLLLTGNRDDTSATGTSKSIAIQTQTCTHESHHCVFAFMPVDASLVVDDMPCVATNSCTVNLVMWAWDPAARPGGIDKVLVGQNEGDYLQNGVVKGDSGRLMVVRERGIAATDRAKRETGGHGDMDVNLMARPEIVYTHALEAGDLAANEQFLIEAKIVAVVSGRARFSTQLVLTRDRNGTDNNVDGVTPTALEEGNGFNCTDGTSPCTAHKVAVLRADRAIAGPIYVNVIVQSEVPGGAPARLTVKRGDGWVRSIRYSARFY